MKFDRKWIKIVGVVGLCFLIFGAVSTLLFREIQSPLVFRATITQLVIGLIGVIFYLVYSFRDFIKGFRQNQDRFTGILGIGLFFVLILGVNIITNVEFKDLQFDTTKSKLFSLNEQSMQVISDMKDPVRILSFVQNRQGKQQTEELLKKYEKLSKLITFESLDPDASPQEALDFGASDTQIVFFNSETEKLEYVDYRTLSEQEVTNALRRTQIVDDYMIYFLQGGGFPKVNFNSAQFRDASSSELNYAPFFLKREGFKLSGLNLTRSLKIPDDAEMVVAWGLQGEVPDTLLAALRDYLNEGGDLVIAQSPYQNATTGELAFGNWNELLKDYNTAFDEKLSLLAIPDKPGFVRVGLTPLVKTEGSPTYSQGIDAQQDVGKFFLSQGVLQIKEKDPENLRRLDFLSSMFRTATTKDISKVRPGELMAESEFEMKDQHSFGVEINLDHEEEKRIDKETKIIVIGNSEFATNKFYTEVFHNNLFLNIFHTAFETEQAIVIPRKTWPRSTLNMTKETKIAVIFASIFLIPELIIVFGLSFWILRRSRA